MSIVIIMTACGGDQVVVSDATATPIRSTSTPAPTALPPLPTVPPLGSSVNPLVMLFVIPEPDDESATAEDLAARISSADGEIEIRLTSSYAEAYQAFCDGSVHVVSLSAFPALAAQESDCGEMLYVAEINELTATQSQMITAVGRNVFTVEGFRGQTFCRTDALSIDTWILPSLMMRSRSLDPAKDLVEVVDMQTDEDVVLGVFTRECSIGATTLGAEEGIANPNPALSGRILIIDELPPLPHDTVLLSHKLSESYHALLLDLLVDSEQDIADLLDVDALVELPDDLFVPLAKLLKDAGVDVAALAH